jgi:two-component system, LytTR family, response regulator
MEEMRIPLTFRFTKKFEDIVFASIGSVIFFQVVNLLSPNHGELRPLFEGRYLDYFKELFSFYFAFEPISVFILFQLLHLYLRVFNMYSMKAEWSAIFIYLAKLFPLIALSIFIFGPITNSVRYLVMYYPRISWNVYFPEFFFTWVMYQRYFVAVFFFGYASFSYNMFRDYDDWQRKRIKFLLQKETQSTSPFLSQLTIYDEQGKGLIKVEDVLFFKVDLKKYYAQIIGQQYEIEATLTELEATLDMDQFFRVNRSVIINLKYFKNYSFWENDKYIVRIAGSKEEFSIQRTRLKELKDKMGIS